MVNRLRVDAPRTARREPERSVALARAARSYYAGQGEAGAKPLARIETWLAVGAGGATR